MLISQIILRNYGRFSEYKVDFAPGINVIKGPNEGGKSTLANAVMAALFVDPATARGGVFEIERWGNNRAPFLEASLNVDGKTFTLTRDFENNKSDFKPRDLEMPGGKTGNIGTWLSDKLGIDSGDVFRSTAFINQADINHIQNSIEAIKDKLESLASQGKEDQAASVALSILKSRAEELGVEEAGFKTSQDDLKYNIEKLERDMSALRVKRADLIQVETACLNVRDDLAARKAKLQRAEEANVVNERASEQSAQIENLEKQVVSAREAAVKIEEMQSRRSGLKRISKDELLEVERAESRLNHLTPKRGELEEETKEIANDLEAFKIGGFSVVLTVLGFAGLGFTAAVYFAGIVPMVIPYIWDLLAASAGIFILGISMTFSRKQHRGYLSRKHKKAVSILEELINEIEDHEEKLKNRLKDFRVSNVDDLRKNQWQYEELEKQLELQTAQYNKIVDGNILTSLESRLEMLKTDFKDTFGQSEGLSSFLIGAADMEKERLVINEIEERVKDLERERKVLQNQIEMAEGGSELLASYRERLERYERKNETSEHERQILDLTARLLEEARLNALVSKLEILNKRTSEILDNLTGGRYSRVRFDKLSLKFEVWSDEKGDWVDPEKNLSSSTVEQIYLAARLALSDLVSEEKNSILIFDDPFGNYDDKRLDNVMRVLKNLSADHQILLLTSQDHYDKWANNTISL